MSARLTVFSWGADGVSMTNFADQPHPTPPAALAQVYTGWWDRVGASVADGVIRLVPVLILGVVAAVVIPSFITPGTGTSTGLPVSFGVGIVALLLILWLYAPLLMRRPGIRNGQTLGKQMHSFTVTRDNGEPIGFWFAVLREVVVKGILFDGIGGVLFYIPTLVNYLWATWDEENRCLHDIIVNTHVVPTPPVPAAPTVPLAPVWLPSSAQGPSGS